MMKNLLLTRFSVLLFLSLPLIAAVAFAQAPDTTGPYKLVMEMDPSLPDHTIFRPENLSSVKGKLPIVAVAHGACYDVGNFSSRYAYEIASYGFLVVADGAISQELEAATGKLVAARRQAVAQSNAVPQPDLGAALPQAQLKRSKTRQLFEAMDWAKMQSEKAGSPYQGKLEPAAIAVMGASCGALQALDASLDPRVKTVIVLNSGIMRTGIPEGEAARELMADLQLPGPDILKKLQTPVIYLMGGPSDIAFENSVTDFAEIEKVFVFSANLNVGHGGTFFEPHGGKFAEAATQWLLWQLRSDVKAGAMFVGDKCGLCTAPEWKVERKNLR